MRRRECRAERDEVRDLLARQVEIARNRVILPELLGTVSAAPGVRMKHPFDLALPLCELRSSRAQAQADAMLPRGQARSDVADGGAAAQADAALPGDLEAVHDEPGIEQV